MPLKIGFLSASFAVILCNGLYHNIYYINFSAYLGTFPPKYSFKSTFLNFGKLIL